MPADTAYLDDPLIHRSLSRVGAEHVNTLLLSLAAWQRGLEVTYHHPCLGSPPMPASSAQDGRSDHSLYMTVSDGDSTHAFYEDRLECNIESDRQVNNAPRLGNSWQSSTELEVQHFSHGDMAEVGEFVAANEGRMFGVEPSAAPLTGGTKTAWQLNGSDVLAYIESHASRGGRIGAYPGGIHLRAFVVGGRCVNVVSLSPLSIEGDGLTPISQLLNHIADERQPNRHPLWQPPSADDVNDSLAQKGFTGESILAPWQRLTLSHSLTALNGTDIKDVSGLVSASLKEACVKAVERLGLEIACVDVITNHATQEANVLSVSPQVQLCEHAFAIHPDRPNNRVAEAVIDYCFPDTAMNTRRTSASFDLHPLVAPVMSGVVADVSLPVLSSDWTHRRIRLPAHQINDYIASNLHSRLLVSGVHHQTAFTPANDLVLDIVAPAAKCQRVLKKLGLVSRSPLAKKG